MDEQSLPCAIFIAFFMNSSFLESNSPILAPQAECLLETESTMITLSAYSGSIPKEVTSLSSYANSLYTSSAIIQRSCSLAISPISFISSKVKTVPVGLPGEIQTIALVLSVMHASICSLFA